LLAGRPALSGGATGTGEPPTRHAALWVLGTREPHFRNPTGRQRRIVARREEHTAVDALFGMSGLFVLLPQAPAFVPLHRPTHLLHRGTHPRCSSLEPVDALDFSVRLVKPMGLQLEEEEAGSTGLRVVAVLRDGSAAASGRV